MKHKLAIDTETVVKTGIICVSIGFIIWIIVSAASNANKRITAGKIINKWYYAAYTSTNAEGYVEFHPAQYWMEIEGQKNGEIVSYYFQVPEAEYFMYQIGDWYGKEG